MGWRAAGRSGPGLGRRAARRFISHGDRTAAWRLGRPCLPALGTSAAMETHRESLARLLLPAQRSDRSHSALMRLCSSPRSGRRQGKRASSTRLDELGTGRKWKRKPVPSIADKAGRRAAYSCPQPLAAPAQGPSHQGLSRGSHLRGRQGPRRLAGCGGGVAKCQWDRGEKG